MQPLENSGGITAYGSLIALGLVVVWTALLIPLLRGRLKTAPFLAASVILAFFVVFFWLWPTITEISLWKFGSIKTNVEQARAYLGQLQAIEGEVANIKARIEADATRAHALQQQLMPRLLVGGERQKFTNILLGDPGHTIVIVSAMLDHEAGDFADSFVQPFKGGQWTVGPRVTNWIRPQDGVTIGRVDDTPLPGEMTLDSALTAAAIKHTRNQITGDDAHAISPWFTTGTLSRIPRIEHRF